MPRRESSFCPNVGYPRDLRVVAFNPFGCSGWDRSRSLFLFLLLRSTLRPRGGRRRRASESVPSHLSPAPVSSVSCPGPYVTRSVAKLLIISIYIGNAKVTAAARAAPDPVTLFMTVLFSSLTDPPLSPRASLFLNHSALLSFSDGGVRT